MLMDTKKMNQHDVETWGVAAAKIAPPAGVTAAKLFGMHVSEIVLWLTLLYTVLLVSHKLWKMALEGYDFWVRGKRPWNRTGRPPIDED